MKMFFKNKFWICSTKNIRAILILCAFFFLNAFCPADNTFAQATDDAEKSVLTGVPEYSLTDLYRIALERAEQIKISEEDVFIAERGKDKAVSALLPTISAFGDYKRYSEEKESSTSFGSFTIQPESSSIWGLRLDQSLSLGGREIKNYQISKKNIDLSLQDLYTVKEEYLLSVSLRYFDVLKSRKGLEIVRANLERLKKYKEEAEIKLKVGEITKTALFRAEAELSGAQSDLVRAENTLKLAKAALARLVGIENEYVLKDGANNGLTESLSAKHTLDSLKQAALSERAEIKSGNLRRKIAEEQVKFAKGAYWPTLSIEGVYSRMDEDPSSPFFNKESIYGVLRLNFPFFEGGIRRAEVREAEAIKKQTELLLEDLKKTISIEVEEAYLNVKTQLGILNSLRDQVDFARENYHMVSKQFQYGLVDSLDVIDANTLLVTSERELANAQYDYQFALMQLQRATGRLLETVIDEGIDTAEGE